MSSSSKSKKKNSNLKINNIYPYSKTKKIEKFSKPITMRIGKHKISDFLKFYKIDPSLESIFLKNHIKYSYDLNDTFYDRETFFKFLVNEISTHKKLTRNNLQNKTTQLQFFDEIEKIMFAYDNFKSQIQDYKIYFSIFGEVPNKKQFIEFLNSEKFKSFFSDSILELINKDINEVISIYEFFGVKNLLDVNFNYKYDFILVTNIDYLINFKKIFLHNFDTVKNETQYKEFVISKTEDFKQLLHPNNNLNVENMISNLIETGYEDIVTVIEEDSIDELIYEIFEIKKKFKILTRVRRMISRYLFPDRADRYITKMLNYLPKKITYPNIRVFIISAHGYNINPDEYKIHERLDFDLLYNSILPTKKKSIDNETFKKNINIVFTQSYGRLSYQTLVDTIIKAYNNYGTQISNGILNSKTKSDFNKINEFLRILHYQYFHHIKFESSIFLEYGLNEYLKNPDGYKKHYKDNKIFDIIKYNIKKPPPNSHFNFGSNSNTGSVKGIFELKDETIENLLKLSNKCRLRHSTDDIDKLGLSKDMFLSAIKNKPEILKYNEKLFKKYYKMISVADAIKFIYDGSDIKPNEKVLIYMNHCRGSYSDGTGYFNEIDNLENKLTKIRVLRQLSYNRAFDIESTLNPDE